LHVFWVWTLRDMRTNEIAATLKRYSDRLARFGPTNAALGWTKPKQSLRYRILLEYWLSPPSQQPLRVLDFGCGFGDLFGYARRRGLMLDYTGVDINEDFIRIARERYPQACFVCRDFLSETVDESYDVVLSSGVHNFRLSDNRAYIEQTFDVFKRLARLGVAANFLSTRVNYRNEENYYAAPEEIMTLGLRYSPRVLLRHDYMPFEFTIFVDFRYAIHEPLGVFDPFVADCTD
jgi:SAM-dependent methyltransferase